MSRSPERAALVLAAFALLGGVAHAQDPSVVDLELPVVDLTYGSASLDNSVRTDESAKEVKVTLAADVLFRFDKASLSPRARSRIDEVAGRLRDAPAGAVRIDGYTDAKGSDSYNQGLSQRRAQAVAAALRSELGGDAPALAVRGHGEADPVAANTKRNGSDNPKGRARNRRVTITFPR
jgi:outer membrane protein OmpA-like peptidoglycan-associated protein